MCRNDADALDLTQSAFLRALEALHTFKEKASFYTWIFRIAVNLTISQGRRRKHAPRISLDRAAGEDTPAVQLPGNEPAAANGAEQGELRERLADALDRLDADFRIAVVLKDIEELDYATIAEILDVPVGTVKSRIHRGRMMLRELLEGEYDSS
jgi:RNA polymerase sigma-70 factor (ECF subfamily)